MNNLCGIYILTSPSEKKYVGKSIDIEKRLSNHQKYSSNADTKWARAIRKYGFDNMSIEIIQAPVEQLNMWEKFYIHFYDSFYNGYNGTLGGDGGSTNLGRTFTEEHCEKLRVSNKGLRRSLQTRTNISISGKGRSPWNKGAKGVTTAWNKGISSPLTKIECPNCGKIIGKNVYTRHHGDKCKELNKRPLLGVL
jgi:group I intron endonuclease